MSIATKHQMIMDYLMALAFHDFEEAEYLSQLYWSHFRADIGA